MPSLLGELGGRNGLEIIVAGLLERLLADPGLHRFFDDTSRARLELKLVNFLSALLGDRTADWRGRDLRAVHHDLGIQHDDFDAFLGVLGSTLRAAGVGSELASAVQRRIESMRDMIVAAPGP
jgi:truncated hemoglobin YjbI